MSLRSLGFNVFVNHLFIQITLLNKWNEYDQIILQNINMKKKKKNFISELVAVLLVIYTYILQVISFGFNVLYNQALFLYRRQYFKNYFIKQNREEEQENVNPKTSSDKFFIHTSMFLEMSITPVPFYINYTVAQIKYKRNRQFFV